MNRKPTKPTAPPKAPAAPSEEVIPAGVLADALAEQKHAQGLMEQATALKLEAEATIGAANRRLARELKLMPGDQVNVVRGVVVRAVADEVRG